MRKERKLPSVEEKVFTHSHNNNRKAKLPSTRKYKNLKHEGGGIG